MPTRVRTPDGHVAVFPDGMSTADIQAAMQRNYPPATMRQAPSMLSNLVSGAVEGGKQGIESLIQNTQQGHASPVDVAGGLMGIPLGAVVGGVSKAALPLTAGHYPAAGDPNVVANQRAHPIPFDPNRIVTDKDNADLAGNVVASMIPLPLPKAAGGLRIPEGGPPRVRALPPPRDMPMPLVGPTREPLMAPARPPMPVGPAEPLQGPPVTPLRPMQQPAPLSKELQVAQVLRRAAERDRLTPDQIAAAHAADPTAPAFHGGGENLTTLAEVAAQSPGEAQTILRQAIETHRGEVPNHVRSDIATSLGGKGDYLDTLTGIQEQRSKAANEGMKQIGDHLVTLNENSVSALRSDLAKGAIKDAASNALASHDPEIRAAGASLNRLHDQLLDKPSAITLRVRDAQDISRSLLEGADSAYKAGQGGRGKVLKGLGRAVRDNAATPEQGGFAEYGDWLNQFGMASDRERALQLGMGLFKGGLENTPAYVQKALGKLKGPVGEDYAKGIAEAAIEQVQTGKGDVGTLRQMLGDRNVQGRLRIAFGDQASFDAFMKRADMRVRQQNRNNRVTGGSPTYLRAAARADLEKQGISALDLAKGALDTFGSPAKMAGKGVRALLEALPKADRSVIGDPQANAILGKALADPTEMQRLLELTRARPKPAGRLPMRPPPRLPPRR